ncbi:hypothetical protein B0H63DRAFT_525347 [Podospora didyma]|uniref:Uncharacterized protein n=1 Tax=Podospora didyma TaxID=330526 RepID=A0AAE0KK33_9PEZI|nr:hypothetical protein B0H63DRAFT_525347 [Podospora didyma]
MMCCWPPLFQPTYNTLALLIFKVKPTLRYYNHLKTINGCFSASPQHPDYTSLTMSPTYTMSAHLCKQIYSSWRQTKQTSDSSPLPSPPTSYTPPSYFQRSPSPEKRSMDTDRSDSSSSQPTSQQPASSSWKWGSR